MLCNLFEDTRKKCDQYWPSYNDINNTNKNLNISNNNNYSLLEVDEYIIYLQSEEYKLNKNVVERNIKLVCKLSKTEHFCTQIQVICWPDHSVPSNDVYYKLFEYIFSSIDYYKYIIESKQPILVHCSAGIGRTGTLISMYNIYDQINKQLRIIKNSKLKDLNHILFSVFTQVRKTREQRYMSVSDYCQYNLIYTFIYEYLKIMLNDNNIIDENIMSIKDKLNEFTI